MNKPFLKWAGSKTKVMPLIKKELPEGKRLIEPFVGSGAVFLNTDYEQYILTDINEDLIDLYNYLKKDVSFIDYAFSYFEDNKWNTEELYYTLRTKFNNLKEQQKTLEKKKKVDKKKLENIIKEKSALFIYLNRHGFNGLCRYNLKGFYNVPYGKYKQPYFPRKEMEFFHLKSQRASFFVSDFKDVMLKKAQEGDVVYCDPPYAPLDDQKTAFTSYSSGGFGLKEQQTLSNLAEKLSYKKIPVLISNHDTCLTRELYKEAKIKTFLVQRSINCDGFNRKKAEELLAFFQK